MCVYIYIYIHTYIYTHYKHDIAVYYIISCCIIYHYL